MTNIPDDKFVYFPITLYYGSGKTYFGMKLLEQDIKNGASLVYVGDMLVGVQCPKKEEPETT